MTREDRDKVRAYLGSPEGRSALDEINRIYYARQRELVRQSEAPSEGFWRDSPPGALPADFLVDSEASNATAPDLTNSRSFRPPYLDRRVSHWPAIFAVLVASSSCGALIAWGISRAVGAH